MSAAFEFEFDPGGLERLAEGLRSVTGEGLGRAAIEAVNAVATAFDREQRAGQIAGINLTAGYVDSKTRVTLASNPANPRAEIRTDGSLTTMGHYDAQRQYRPAERDRRGRLMGRRQAGTTVQIRRGEQQYHFSWFVMPLKGQGGKLGVFVREPGSKAKHLYAVSPYSLARFQAAEREDDLQQQLETQGAAAIADLIDKALTL